MSTIKFVPMEFFAQFGLTQMRRLQARGGVGAALGVRGGVGGRRSLFVRLFRRGVPIVNAGRCRRGFPGAGTSLADVGRCLRAWGAVGVAFSSTGTSLADVESCWWAQVAVCTAFPAQGAYCERWALSARLSGSGNIVGGRGELLVDVGRCWWAQVAACGMRRCLRTLVAVCAAFSGARERRPVLRTPPPFRAAHGACRSACPLAARPHPPRRGACFPARPLAARPPPFRRAACRSAA